MQLDAIKLFCDVAHLRSVSKAAKLHGVTQSAASQRIMALERELKVQLIDRSKRPLHLTAKGQIYHDGCRRIIHQYEMLKRQVLSDHLPVEGVLRVAAIYSAGIGLIDQAADVFENQFNDAKIEIEYRRPDGVYDRVMDGRVDLGILSFPDRWQGLSSQILRNEEMCVVCHPSHDLAARDNIRASELPEFHLVQFDADLPISQHIDHYLRKHQVAAKIRHRFDNIDTIKSYLAHSREVAILPAFTVKPDVDAGLLTAITLVPTLVRPLAIVVDRKRQITPLMQAFMDDLLKRSPNGAVVAAAESAGTTA